MFVTFTGWRYRNQLLQAFTGFQQVCGSKKLVTACRFSIDRERKLAMMFH